MSARAVIVIALFLVSEGALLVVYHFGGSALQEDIKFGATVVAAAFALFELMQKTQHDRYESSGKFIERWNDPQLGEIRKQVREILTDALLLDPLIKKSERTDQFNLEQKTLRGQVIGVLNFFEEMAIAVGERRADEKYLHRYFSTTVDLVWNKLEPWIQADRRFGESSYWCEFERLAKGWSRALPWWL